MPFFDNGTFGSSNVRNNTVVVGGTLIVLAFIGAITYLTSTDRPTDVAIGLMLPIISSVVATIFVAGKVDTGNESAKIAANKADVAADKADVAATKVDTVVEQTNGGLDERIQKAIVRALAQHATNQGAEDVRNTSVHSEEIA